MSGTLAAALEYAATALAGEGFDAHEIAPLLEAREVADEFTESAAILLAEWDRQDTGRFDGMTAKDFFAAEARFRAAYAKASGGQP